MSDPRDDVLIPFEDIREQLGVSKDALYRAVKRAGVEPIRIKHGKALRFADLRLVYPTED